MHSMAWKRSSVRSRSGPPKHPNVLRLRPAEPEHEEALHWLHGTSIWPACHASAWTDSFNARPRSLGPGIRGRVLDVVKRSKPRAAARSLEIASFDTGTDRRSGSNVQRVRLAGKVISSVPIRSTNNHHKINGL